MSATRTYCRTCSQPQIPWPGRTERACVYGHGLRPAPESRFVPAVRKLAAVLLLVALAVSALPLPGQEKRRGAGYVTPQGARAVWITANQPEVRTYSRPMNTACHPWPAGMTAEHAGGWLGDPEQFYCRYGLTATERPIFYPQGYRTENYGLNAECLEILCLAGAAGFGPPSAWDCNPTAEEAMDFAVRTPEGRGAYAECFSLARGGQRPQECPACPTCKPCPACPVPEPCPAIECPSCPPTPVLSAGVRLALERLRAAADLSTERPVNIGPALRGYLRRVDEWIRANIYQPGLPSTGRLDTKEVPGEPDGLTLFRAGGVE